MKQTSSVSEYVEVFDELVHQLLAYDPYFSLTVITSRFVDGLKIPIKSVVLVHRPKDLDIASSLAIFQEEVLLGYLSNKMKRNDSISEFKQSGKMGFPSVSIENSEVVHVSDRKLGSSSKGKVQNEKLAALMAYRKAKGLCYKCGNKWGPQHKCPESVSLHVVEELWQMISEEDAANTIVQEDPDSGEDLMAISDQAIQGTTFGKTIKLACHIQKNKAVLLFDSGSSHNFISEQRHL